MTNKDILTAKSFELAERNILNCVRDDNGTIVSAEEINTAGKWKALGFRVPKNELPVATISLWRYAPEKRDSNGKVVKNNYVFMKDCCVYSRSQVISRAA